MRKLEVHIRHVKHYVHAELEAPKQRQVGRIIVLEEDAAAHLPDVWFSSDHSLFYVQAIRNPAKSVRHIQIADHVIVDVTVGNMVAGLWLLDLPQEVRTSCNQPQYICNESMPNT